jgi:anti-sigma regulatory factor (Ser/Thr protein kinase)
MTGPTTEFEVQRTLRADPAAVAKARGLLERVLEDCHVERGDRSDALLVLSELFTNAVVHGSRPGDQIDFELKLDTGRLWIRVRDAARARTVPAALTPGRAAACWSRAVYRRSSRRLFRANRGRYARSACRTHA